MDDYHSHFAYAASADANAYMSSLRYPGMGMTPMLGPMHMPSSMDHMYNASVSAPAPQASSEPLPYSSRIGGKPSTCFIYHHDEMAGITGEIKCHQLCTSDGRLFVEHLPNHSIVFIPSASNIDRALSELRKPRSQTKQQQQQQKQLSSVDQALPAPQVQQPAPPPVVRKVKEKSNKPINAFIKYRSFKIAELKNQFPEVSQTEISRLAGECWKTESEDIKNQFRVQYQEEKKVYDMKKAITTGLKRSREMSSTLSENDAAALAVDESTSAPLPEGCADSADGALAGIYPEGFDPKRRRRSLTLPPTGPTACVRSSSSSPMLHPQTAAKRRRCVTTELRRQLAAKTSGLMSTPPPSMAPSVIAARSQSMGVEHQYAGGYYGDLSFGAGGLDPVEHISAHGSPAMMAAIHPHPYLGDMSSMSLPLDPTFAMPHSDYASMSPPHLANDGSVLSINTSFVNSGSVDQHSSPFDIYSQPGQDDYTSSIVNSSLVAANLSSFMAAGDDGLSHSVSQGLAPPGLLLHDSSSLDHTNHLSMSHLSASEYLPEHF